MRKFLKPFTVHPAQWQVEVRDSILGVVAYVETYAWRCDAKSAAKEFRKLGFDVKVLPITVHS